MKETAVPSQRFIKSSTHACSKALLVGMVNSKVELGRSLRRGQLERDGRRCDALEATGIQAYTLDTNHETGDCFVKSKRHFQGNISDWRRLRKSLAKHVTFDYIYVDYIHMPPCYIKSILSSRFFTQTLKGLVEDQVLPLHGEIWVPNIDCSSIIKLNMSSITKYFACELVKDPMENKLYATTETINDVLETLSDGCSNRVGAGNLSEAPGGSFFKLTRIR